MKTALLSVMISCTFFVAPLFSQETDTTGYTICKYAAQMMPVGIIFGDYGVNMEALLTGKHSILVGGSRSTSATKDGYSMEMNYRHYKQPTLAGGFWGLFVRYVDLEEQMKLEENGNKKSYPYTFTSWITGVHFGTRWLWKDRMSITWRLGCGIPFSDFEWVDGEPEAGDLIEILIKIFSGVDGELSVGIAF